MVEILISFWDSPLSGVNSLLVSGRVRCLVLKIEVRVMVSFNNDSPSIFFLPAGHHGQVCESLEQCNQATKKTVIPYASCIAYLYVYYTTVFMNKNSKNRQMNVVAIDKYI